jgi:glycerol-3-phosphate acyltransferase PlsY
VFRLLAAAGAGYLLGTVPAADIASRLAAGGSVDLRAVGSGNPGAVNAMTVLGTRWGYGVLAADIGKGVAASALGRWCAGVNGAHVGATAAVVGHCFPAWSRFRGGKGVSTSCGQCLATFPAYFPIDVGLAWAVAHWRQRALPATAVASAAWVAAGVLWWRRGWPNAWGPEPTAALPLAAAVSSAVILSRFATARDPSP